MTTNQPAAETPIQPTNDGCDTLYSATYGETFHSTHGALVEADHVFLEGTGVKPQLREQQNARILEVGFGTGLNFWLTAFYCLQFEAKVEYVALEKDLLPAQTLARLNHGALLEPIRALRQEFLRWRAALAETRPGTTLHWDCTENIRLTLLLGDATQLSLPDLAFQAVYLDAFSPAANPELWEREFLAKLYGVLAPGGRLATYSAKGEVRRNLQAVGFEVRKRPGPPGKREMVVATRAA